MKSGNGGTFVNVDGVELMVTPDVSVVIHGTLIKPSPKFEDWIKGFEGRYTEDQLWHMKWAFEVGVSLANKGE